MGEDVFVWRARYANRAVTADEETSATIARLEKGTADWTESAKSLLAQIEGREGPPFEVVGDEPPV